MTRPARINSSTCRREPSPACAKNLFNLSIPLIIPPARSARKNRNPEWPSCGFRCQRESAFLLLERIGVARLDRGGLRLVELDLRLHAADIDLQLAFELHVDLGFVEAALGAVELRIGIAFVVAAQAAVLDGKRQAFLLLRIGLGRVFKLGLNRDLVLLAPLIVVLELVDANGP